MTANSSWCTSPTLLLDNEPTAARVNLDLGFSIYGRAQEGTIVTFCVHPEDVTLGEYDEDGEIAQWPAIVDRPALAPEGYHWETVHARDRGGEIGDWVRVYLYVREVKVLPRPQAGRGTGAVRPKSRAVPPPPGRVRPRRVARL